MKRHILISGILILFSLTGITTSLLVKQVEDPQVIAQREKMQKKAEETGYADIEIDNLHKKITTLLPKLESIIKKDEEKKENIIVIPIASGESVKSISKRYLYDGLMYLYTNADNTQLEKIVIRFTRMMPLGQKFKEERRELINPTPKFHEDNKIDGNDDLSIIYYEFTLNKEKMDSYIKEKEIGTKDSEFKEIDRIVLKEIPYFDKRISLVETYKKWLRKATRKLESKVTDIEMHNRVQIQHIMTLK